uniref:Peptidase S1 domain-containing protein n=1 Tax=Anopheles melas TaxID=34690 RepID=A0A182TQB8_9DIPT
MELWSFQASRNLRHLPCVVRNTGEEGICMFAIDCFKANGTHLGVCIDKIFFGSCCQVNDDRLLFDPDITDNSIDHNSVGNFQHFPPSVNTHRKPPLTETRLPTTAPGNGTKYELLSTSTTTRRTTSKNNRRTTSTTLRTTKAPQKVQQKDDLQTTTEYQEFTTFQYVQSSKNPAGSSSPTSNKRPSARPSLTTQDNRVSTTRTTTYKPYKTRRPTTNKTSAVRPPNRRPAQPLTTTTEAPTTTPPSTTRKVSGQSTRHPTTSSTIGSRKPPSSIAASQTQTTIASRRPATTQSTPKPESTTPSVTYSRRPTTSPSLVPLTKPTTNRRRPTTTTTTTTKTTVPATTSSETTRAPRPRPKPTSQVATVPATSLDHLVETHSSSSEATSSSAVPSSSTSKPTYPSTTVKVTQPTTPTPTPTPASSTTRSTQSEPSVQSSTIKVPAAPINLGDSEDLASLSRPGLVTWTSILEDTPTERPSSNQGPTTSNSWILIQTLTPEEVVASNQTNQHEPSSSTHTPPASVEVSFSQDTKLPIESLLPEAAYVYNTVPEEEPAPNILLLPDDLSVHSQVTSTSRSPDQSLEAQSKTTESSVASSSTTEQVKSSTLPPYERTSTTVRHSSIVPPTTTDSTTIVTRHGPVSSTTAQSQITQSPAKPSSEAVEAINESVETTLSTTIVSSSPRTTEIPVAAVTSTHFTSSAAPTLTTRTSSTTDVWSSSKRPPAVDVSSTTETMIVVRETTTAAEESIENATEGSGEEESGSGSEEGSSEEEEEEEGEEGEEAPVTSDRGPTTTQGTSTTGMPIKFPEQPASNQTALPTTTTLAMLANVTTDGVTLAPDFLTTSTLPTLEGIDYRSVCGKRMFPEPRIVGGTKAAFGRWPWQISLRQWRTSTYLHKCGAALLNENWAITAAHCVDNVPPSDLLLRLGEYDLALEEEPYGYQERRVQIVASHPQFDPRTFEYDLALLRFYEPVVFQPNIIPVCVPENDENFIGRTAFVTGWGRLYEDGPLPSVLQEVTVPVIENKICETMYRSAGYIEHIPHIFICAGWKKGGYDSCEGDSGGPMVIQRTDKRFLLAGVISWGIGCAEPNQPGVYTRISEFRDWINQILQF